MSLGVAAVLLYMRGMYVCACGAIDSRDVYILHGNLEMHERECDAKLVL